MKTIEWYFPQSVAIVFQSPLRDNASVEFFSSVNLTTGLWNEKIGTFHRKVRKNTRHVLTSKLHLKRIKFICSLSPETRNIMFLVKEKEILWTGYVLHLVPFQFSRLLQSYFSKSSLIYWNLLK